MQGYVCNFRRRVVRVWTQTACRANSQGGKHCPWKPSFPWRDATNRWMPITCPNEFTEKCCCCTCCRKHGRRRPEYLERLHITQYFSPRASYCLVVPPEDCRGNIVGLEGAQEKSMKQEGRRQGTTWKNDIAQAHNMNWLKSNGSKMASQIQLNLDPPSES